MPCHAIAICRQELALVIPAYRRQIERHQAIRRVARQKRAREDVAEIDDQVHAAPLDVGQHRIERAQISMNVRDCCNSHETKVSENARMSTSSLQR